MRCNSIQASNGTNDNIIDVTLFELQLLLCEKEKYCDLVEQFRDDPQALGFPFPEQYPLSNPYIFSVFDESKSNCRSVPRSNARLFNYSLNLYCLADRADVKHGLISRGYQRIVIYTNAQYVSANQNNSGDREKEI